MTRIVSTAGLTAGVLALTASAALGQPPPGGPPPEPSAARLLRSDKVQDELKLTDDQRAPLKKIEDKYSDDIRKAFMAMDIQKGQDLIKSATDEVDKTVAELFKPEQVKRLDQLKLQAGGLNALVKDDVAGALKLTDQQKKDITEQRDELEKDARDMRQNVRNDPDKRREAFQKIRAMRTDAFNKVLDGLTDDQKKAWKDLAGDKFDFEFPPPRPPGGDKPKDK